jgi:hypothetical protein
MTSMFVYETSDEDISTNAEAYYETLASQEEIYLEETEEELRMILESCDPPLTGGESLVYAIEDAAKEFISRDLDDPPLNEEKVEECLPDRTSTRNIDLPGDKL